MPEAGKTRRLVLASVAQRPSALDTPFLREALKFAPSAGVSGLSQADKMAYVTVLLLAERRGRSRRLGGHHGSRRLRDGHRQPDAERLGRRHVSVVDDLDGSSSDEDGGEISRDFLIQTSIVAAVRGEKRRVLAKLC